jgi:hypothetical protein
MGEVIRPPQWDDRWTRYAACQISQRRAQDRGEQIVRPGEFERAFRELKAQLKPEEEARKMGIRIT